VFRWLRKKTDAAQSAAMTRLPGEFQGSPWNAEPTADWNRPSHWLDYYHGLLAEKDAWRRESVTYRGVDLLIRMLNDTGELPRSSPQTLLDAGCGIALIPHLLAQWGFQVSAIDSCPMAVEVASRHRPNEEDLARCIPIWDPCQDHPGARELVADPARSLQRLRQFQAPGGSVTYSVGDWFTADLPSGGFGVVYCRNSLRCSTKSYWQQSLQRFRELLSPGGVLLLETVNAVGIQDEVDGLLAECGFVPLSAGTSRGASCKYIRGVWPTG
jgi:SAM-dependent methyltransferase